MLGVAACLNALGQTNEAKAAYSDVIKRYSSDNVASQAKLALARIYEAQNDLPKAKELYAGLRDTFGNNSALGSEAMIRLQDLFTKHPELFQDTSAATNAPVISPGNP